MKALLTVAVLSSLLLSSAPAAHAADADDRPARITCLMAPEDIEATGIRTLTAAQIDALSAWVETYRVAAQRLALVEYIEGDSLQGVAVESRIDGEFDGWEGETVFRLENGQIWQQVSPSARYHYARHPRVSISPAPHKMRVEGIPYEIAVRRLR
jgi:hypothetical protein